MPGQLMPFPSSWFIQRSDHNRISKQNGYATARLTASAFLLQSVREQQARWAQQVCGHRACICTSMQSPKCLRILNFISKFSFLAFFSWLHQGSHLLPPPGQSGGALSLDRSLLFCKDWTTLCRLFCITQQFFKEIPPSDLDSSSFLYLVAVYIPWVRHCH